MPIQRVVADARVRDPALRVVRQAAPLVFGGLCIWLVTQRLEGLAPARVLAAAGTLTPAQWLAAVAATVMSYAALARYDLHGHALCRTGVSPARAQKGGFCAIALSQTIGLGVVTGSLVRWKLLPELSLARAALVTGTVSAMFMLGWVLVVCALSIVLVPAQAHWFALAALGGVAVLMALSVWRPACRGGALPWPSLGQIAALLSLTALDLGGAALTFWALLPPGAAPMMAEVLPIVVLAIGLGLISGTPGGLGAFELTLLAGLPMVAPEDMVAAILCFRLIYFAAPATVAAGWLVRDHLADRPHMLRLPPPAPDAAHPRAETALVPHNGGRVLHLGAVSWPVVDTGQAMTALFDPVKGAAAPGLDRLRILALRTGRCALAYKLGARGAVTARQLGWRCVHLCDDAVIDLDRFDLTHRSRRQLRRKLRRAEAERVTVRRADLRWDMPALMDLARAWQDLHGRERGISMGRVGEDMMLGQMVLIAERDGQPLAFASFHLTPQELCLDLMRHGSDLPDGTMHALVAQAIAMAGDQGLARVSLAAAPRLACGSDGWLAQRLLPIVDRRGGGPGLRQFKSSFGPRWQPLYAAAPSRAALVIGLLDLSRAIHKPDNIGPPPMIIADD